MKNYTLILLLAAMILFGCNNSKVQQYDSDTIDAQEKITNEEDGISTTATPYNATMLDLFYGMGSMVGDSSKDTTLLRIPHLVKSEIGATWYNNKEQKSFYSTLGLYIDEEFPSSAVFRRIEEAIDTTLIEDLSPLHYLDKNSFYRKRKNKLPQNSTEIVEFATSMFSNITKNMSKDSFIPGEDVAYMTGARVCIVAHKVYERENLSTYLIESSADYNGSCGCPSQASYITLDNKSGDIITANDIIKPNNLPRFKKVIHEEFCKYIKSIGFQLNLGEEHIEWLWVEKDGIALINEGVLVFYKPYSIGPGSMGQVNLIIPYDKM